MRYFIFALVVLSFSAMAKVKIPKVTLDKANLEAIENELYFPVQIKSKVDSRITADSDYIVIKRLVELGQKVKKGDPLLELKRQDTSMQYQSRILRAPVGGMVASMNALSGQFVHKGDYLIHLNDPKKLYGQIEVSAADYKKIKSGLTGKMDLTSLNIKEVPISVKSVGAVVDQVSGTVSVELDITEKMEDLIPGVVGLAKITLNKEEKILVPEKSLYYIGDKVYIPTLDKDKMVKKIPVKLGKRYKENIEIVEGLAPQTEYIKEAAQYLRDGNSVEVNQKPKKL